MAQQQQIQHQIQQTRTGECNILPRLIDHLHSTLELWCSNDNSDEQLLFEDSSANSKENFRLWINQFDSTSIKIEQKSNININFVENILLADIHRGLHTLQDLLKRVDICTLTKYNATLNPQSKLYLIRLISNLLRKLKIPENANLKLSESEKNKSNGKTMVV
ncbi:PREDICTED: uncharacterized protein LOC105359885 [Ceratosolen solmsi marchali]|uniref:Uncharacterized protein LOC105359885 n=1 Tax=Ceratosolen solmsi marchali TaxID=326594 RepID=A0AAJ6YC17_9HYME|nr:PREDICTED: uncharacterized protein LOC105359885 [Ceratosolen solmsi marchali]